MSIERIFMDYAVAFEQTYQDDDWSRLEAYLSPTLTYEVCNMPFHCEINGRAEVFKGIQKSINGFDRRCKRSLPGPTVFKAESNKVLVFAGVTYKLGDQSTSSTLWEIATIVEGKIQRLIDLYSPGDAEGYEAFLASTAVGLDAAYV